MAIHLHFLCHCFLGNIELEHLEVLGVDRVVLQGHLLALLLGRRRCAVRGAAERHGGVRAGLGHGRVQAVPAHLVLHRAQRQAHLEHLEVLGVVRVVLGRHHPRRRPAAAGLAAAPARGRLLLPGLVRGLVLRDLRVRALIQNVRVRALGGHLVLHGGRRQTHLEHLKVLGVDGVVLGGHHRPRVCGRRPRRCRPPAGTPRGRLQVHRDQLARPLVQPGSVHAFAAHLVLDCVRRQANLEHLEKLAQDRVFLCRDLL
mmetsp:Transcript_7362/g.13014  ORF Transcript_7362/g.13014 Transcript_7362/m.13014 type:complete len:257 (+) Transcript_7362:621-1391(+)